MGSSMEDLYIQTIRTLYWYIYCYIGIFISDHYSNLFKFVWILLLTTHEHIISFGFISKIY